MDVAPIQEPTEDERIVTPSRRSLLKHTTAGALLGGLPSVTIASQGSNNPVVARLIHEVDLPSREEQVRAYLQKHGISESEFRKHPDRYESELEQALRNKVSRERSLLNVDFLQQNSDSDTKGGPVGNHEALSEGPSDHGFVVTKATNALRPVYAYPATDFYDAPKVSVNKKTVSVAGNREFELPPGRSKSVNMGVKTVNLQLKTFVGGLVERRVKVRPSVVLRRAAQNGGGHYE